MENLPTYRLTQSGPEAQEILDQVNLNTVDIEQLKKLYQALNQSEPEIIEPTDTWPVANPEENVIYRVIDRVNTPPQYYSDYMWNGTSMVLMSQYNNAIDNEPTANSNNLVKSGGVYSFVHANGGAYDISAAHAVGGVLATYDDLADALGTNGANVPAAVRKGGMSIKFVLSSDNKYVQYRLMSNSFNTTVSNWQGVDANPIDGSKNLVESGGVYTKLTDCSEIDQKLFQSILQGVKSYTTVITPTVIDNKYLDINGSLRTFKSQYYKVLEYSVNAGEKYHLICKNTGSNAHFALYKDSSIQSYYRGSSETIAVDIMIPSGINKIYVAWFSGVGSISEIEIQQTTEIQTETVKNIIKNYNVLEGYYLSGSNGELVNFSSNPDYKVSQANIIGGIEYEIHASGVQNQGAYAFLDGNNNIISFGKLLKSLTEETFTVTAPESAEKINIASYKGPFVSYMFSIVPIRRWKGKTWVVLGDSLTEVNARTSVHYFDFVAEKTGLTVVNRGISGTGYKNGEANNNAFYQRVSNLPSCDVLTIFGSFNDNVYFSDMGTKDDTTTTTIGGCINICLDNLFAANPLINVGIVAPCPWRYFYPGVTNSDNYVKLLKDICEKRGIPFYDLYHNSSLRPWEQSYRALCYSKDGENGVHPDETGHSIIAPRFEDFLNELLL